ncbi:MAG: hypothetical protein HYX68_29065 [Planctomycetes bacterium]|jgi:hypothetical protein|nr:hypothetical protein [Planctomycetota bacterium]
MMTNIVTGIVTNGVVIPTSALPEGALVDVCVRSATPTAPSAMQKLTASELRKLPREKREAILVAGAAAAEELYRTDKDLTGFDAFSEELDDDSDEG